MGTKESESGGYFVPGFISIGFTPVWNRSASALGLLWDLQAAEAAMIDGGSIQSMTSSQTPSARPRIDRLAHGGP
jgi:hypothetical protein